MQKSTFAHPLGYRNALIIYTTRNAIEKNLRVYADIHSRIFVDVYFTQL